MKKFFFLILMALLPMVANAQILEATIDGINYQLSKYTQNALITYGNTCSGELDIPSEVNYDGETFEVKMIVWNAFVNCSGLTKVRIPKTILGILNYVPVPNKDSMIFHVSADHQNPFSECTALESIEVDEENPNMKSVDGVLFNKDGTRLYCYPAGKQHQAYTIPETVTWIGADAFSYNQHLTTLTIPSSVTSIGEFAFAECNNLANVYCYAEDVPDTHGAAFGEVPTSYWDFQLPIASATLHVPAGSVEKYRTTYPWSEFGNIVAMKDADPKESLYGEWWLVGWNDGGNWVEVDTNYVSHQNLSIELKDKEEGYSMAYSMANEIFLGLLTLNGNEMTFEEGGGSTKVYCDYEENLFFENHICDIKSYQLEGSLLRLYYNDEDYFVFTNDFDDSDDPAEPVTYTKDQMATIILPTAPDASKGKYYKLDKCEDGQIIFTQETQPQARTPYIIVPSEDFSIDMNTLDVAGLSPDTVTVGGISFIGSYFRMELPALTGGDGGGSSSSYYDIIDQTPDCLIAQISTEMSVVGALRAYLVVTWDDPINPGGARSPKEKMEIVLLDEGTGISDAELLNDKGQMIMFLNQQNDKEQRKVDELISELKKISGMIETTSEKNTAYAESYYRQLDGKKSGTDVNIHVNIDND